MMSNLVCLVNGKEVMDGYLEARCPIFTYGNVLSCSSVNKFKSKFGSLFGIANIINKVKLIQFTHN